MKAAGIGVGLAFAAPAVSARMEDRSPRSTSVPTMGSYGRPRWTSRSRKPGETHLNWVQGHGTWLRATIPVHPRRTVHVAPDAVALRSVGDQMLVLFGIRDGSRYG